MRLTRRTRTEAGHDSRDGRYRSDDDGSAKRPDGLALPGDSIYPESVHAAPDGTLYVSSIADGEPWKIEAGSDEPQLVIASSATLTSITGVLVNEEGSTAYRCSVDLGFRATPR